MCFYIPFLFYRLCISIYYFGVIVGHVGSLHVSLRDTGNYIVYHVFFKNKILCHGAFISYSKTNVLKLFVSYLPQSFKNLVAKKKRLVVLFSHWLLHAYGIISISRLDKLGQDLPLLALVPGPALFYLLTARFTEPNRILQEGGNGH